MSIVTFRGPQDIRTPQDVATFLAELDRERGPLEESHYDRRLRERREEAAKQAK
jgi:hypothetical protein